MRSLLRFNLIHDVQYVIPVTCRAGFDTDSCYRPQIVLGAEIMKSKKFEVKIYYSGFCTYQIEATNDAEAIIKARNRQIDSIELLSNLENWKEADTAELNDRFFT